MRKLSDVPVLLSGRHFTAQELFVVQETVRMFPNLSRRELAKTLCENLDWFTQTGQYKISSCLQLLEKLESQGLVTLPEKRSQMGPKKKERISFGPRTVPGELLSGDIRDYAPITLEPLHGPGELGLWNEYIHRYHSLGYKRPFGAHQRYFIYSVVTPKPLGCLLFAASAWALEARDHWIGWTETDRRLRLHLVLNNTRLLIFPWVQVKNLASKVLSLAVKRIGQDWQARYGYSPVLLETFIDPEQYPGTCYKAANWVFLGQTKGRGRSEQHNKSPLTRKDIYVYPLVADFRSCLKGETAHE